MLTQPLLLDWTLSCKDLELTLPCQMPVEVHQRLMEEGLIEHPYLGSNESLVQWVATKTWHLTHTFEVTAQQVEADFLELVLTEVDTVADIYVNDQLIRRVSSQFREHVIDLKNKVHVGHNMLSIVLLPAAEEAANRANALPFPIPYSGGSNNKIPHINMLRKTQCHAGWDWGICLMVTGLYQTPSIRWGQTLKINHVDIAQRHINNVVMLDVTIDIDAYCDTQGSGTIRVGEQTLQFDAILKRGQQKLTQTLTIANPKLWWPVGYGKQPLYDFSVKLESHEWRKKIGLRQLEVITEQDEIGSGLVFRVNHVDIFCKGANWIPADALTLNTTPARYRSLLESAVAANMNMIRVWGGGMYERDDFYELCDELGLLVWQDLMFACSLYPSTASFIADATEEVQYQIKRLKHHPSIAMWCGDNEVIGALNWYPESRNNRERYVVNYDRLNRALGEQITQSDPSRRFWPSSPCNGELDYGDAWHEDNRGDMHYWDVWHSGHSFSSYYTVQPRFCSEFGYQSFPSMRTIRKFADEDQLNLTSPVMESHQKNERGNSIMTEMLTRYFRFPDGFANTVYLSQVQQSVAIKIAVEYWRSLRPICMGTLYWQLNDNWPVASWSSLEHNGQWKQLHYHSKRFYQQTLVTLCPNNEKTMWQLVGINDSQTAAELNGELICFDLEGNKYTSLYVKKTLAGGSKTILLNISNEQVEQHAEQHFWGYIDFDESLNNTFYFAPWKKMNLPKADIDMQVYQRNQEIVIELKSDVPAHFVTLEICSDSTLQGRFSDNSFTLFANQTKTITWIGDETTAETLKRSLCMKHLRNTYQ